MIICLLYKFTLYDFLAKAEVVQRARKFVRSKTTSDNIHFA